VARRRAEGHGWPPPMGLDDNRIDDPAYRPRDPVAASSWNLGRARQSPAPAMGLARFPGGAEPWGGSPAMG